MNNDWPIIYICLLCIIVVSWGIGCSMGEKKIKREAVKANVAEWTADKDGNVEFKFKQ